MAAAILSAIVPAVHRLGHVALRVTDMDRPRAFYAALSLRLTLDAADWAYLQSPVNGDGVALLSPVHDHRDGTASFYLQDPEGNWLEIYEPSTAIPSNIGATAIPTAPAGSGGVKG
jgi:catechol 2,3-dioxygenase-like lactoylglutathione lyase family enzyme